MNRTANIAVAENDGESELWPQDETFWDRHRFFESKIDSIDIRLQYVPIEFLTADFLTKLFKSKNMNFVHQNWLYRAFFKMGMFSSDSVVFVNFKCRIDLSCLVFFFY